MTSPMADVKHRYLDRSVARGYDGERFTSLVGRSFDALERRALAAIVRRAARQPVPPSVLDVPCGTGRITGLLLEQGLAVTGGDISTAMIEVAREKLARFGGRVSWRQLDLQRLELADNSVDLVTCIRLFHHLKSDARAAILCELARVTRQYVIVNVSLSSPIYRLRRRVKRALGQALSQESSTWEEIQRESAAAGLRLEAQRFVWPLVSEDLILLFRKL